MPDFIRGFPVLNPCLDYFIRFTHSCHFIVSSPLTATHFYLKLNLNLFPELHIFFFTLFLDPTWISPRTLKLNRFKGLLPCSLLPCLLRFPPFLGSSPSVIFPNTLIHTFLPTCLVPFLPWLIFLHITYSYLT